MLGVLDRRYLIMNTYGPLFQFFYVFFPAILSTWGNNDSPDGFMYNNAAALGQ